MRSLLDGKLPIFPPDYVVATVFLRIEAEGSTQEELKKIIGNPGSKWPAALHNQWVWTAKHKLYENPGDALSDFVTNDFPNFVKAFRILKEKYNAEIVLRLLIGAGDFKKIGYIPNIEFSGNVLKVLSQEGLGIFISMDVQMSKYSKHLEN